MRYIKYLIIVFPLWSACSLFKSGKQNGSTGVSAGKDSISLAKQQADEEDAKSKEITEVPTRETDIEHMDLNLSFDWENEMVIGECVLQCKPYAEWVDTLVLDARRFEINSISISTNYDILGTLPNGLDSKIHPTTFTYPDSEQLHIYIPKIYNIESSSYKIHIKYKAHPRETTNQKGMAISSDKGLYFINSKNKYIDRPKQLWTQGETEHNHNWFPTIDHPNEKITQTISLTVDTTMATLSNGRFVGRKINNNGTHTDTWVQDKPHSPYLVMLAVGNFAIVRDKWNHNNKEINVDYYIEPEFAPYAKTIFGNTSEMMTCYSNFLGVAYPWDKYAQVVVREYVSGAMENTSATLHGEFLNRTPRQWYDNNSEDVIAHELFHQWFGDLVTCKSWHHISLNESFATFGEILWHEYKKGPDAAQIKFKNDYLAGMATDQYKNVPLIRKSYEIPEEVFDGISYPKGGAIIQMLRHELGDKAFFKGLNIYLTQNAYKNAEAHQLRLAFEEASGRDLNWYFNQWYFSPGHPKISAEIAPGSTAREYIVNLSQNGYKLNEEPNPYRLPLQIGFVVNGKMIVKDVLINSYSPSLKFQFDALPDAVLLDPNQQLMAEYELKQTTKSVTHLFIAAETFSQKSYCMDLLREMEIELFEENDKQIVIAQLLKWAQDITFLESPGAISLLDRLEKNEDRGKIYHAIYTLAENDFRKNVRKEALDFLTKEPDEKLKPLLKKLVFDTSYTIQRVALRTYLKLDSLEAFETVQPLLAKGNDIIEKTNVLARLSDYRFTELGQYYIVALQTKSYKQLDDLVSGVCNYLEWSNNLDEALTILNLIENIHDLPVKKLDKSVRDSIKDLHYNTSNAAEGSTAYAIRQKCKIMLDKWDK